MSTSALSPPSTRTDRAGLAVALTGLRKTFGPITAVAGIDVAIAPGEVVALLGPNGSGKSTTIDLMLGLQRPDEGEARLFDRAPAEAARAGMVGAVLQQGGLLTGVSVRELVSVVASLYPKPLRVDEALDWVGALDIADQRTDGLSGGQRQRVRTALALVADPDLLVLDEPTVAMDVESRDRFWVAVRRFAAQGGTVLFATHYLQEAEDFADRVILLRKGNVVADGPTTTVMAAAGQRRIRVTLSGADLAALERLPGVSMVSVRGDVVELRCSDADTALRALLVREPDAHDIEVTGLGLHEAFLALTGDPVEADDATEAQQEGAAR